MANNNTVTVTYKVQEDGSLKQIAKDADGAAKATGNLTNSRNRYSKGEKGVAGITANGTKAFSKMNQTLVGGNGLVAAYATLAANVFAATAAFNVFRRAAQVRQLEQGLIAVGAAAGQNLPDVAKRLQDITDSAISSEQAMRATAVGISSGFRSDQLQKLALVAKGASIALGRDMGDALDRLVRGTAKVEPEILDELGIIVRLDEAVQNYADKMGIAASSMNQFQRSQAFLNAVTEQGIAKYQDIATAVDPNPYDKLAAALANLQKSFVNAINGAGKLSSFVNYASENLSSLTAVATTLGLTVTRSVAPGLFTMAESAAENAKQLAAQQANLTENIDLAGKLPEKYKNAVKAMQEHGITAEGMAEAEDSLARSIIARQSRLESDIEKNKLSQEQIETRTRGIQEMRARQEELTRAQNTLTLATSKQSQANAIAAASSLNFKEAFSELKTSVTDYSKGLKEADKDGTKTKKMFNGLRVAGFAASGGIKAVGAALFTMLPYIGLIISAGTFLYTFLRDKFFPKDVVQERIDKAIESFENFSEITAAFDRSIAEGGTRLANSYIAFAGILDQIQAKILEVTDANSKEFTNSIISMEKELDILKKRLGEGGDLSLNMVQLSRAISQGDEIGKDRADALDRVAEIESKLESKAEKLAELQKISAAQVLQGAIQRLKIERDIAGINDKTSPFTIKAMGKSLAQLEALKKKLDAGTISLEEFYVEFEKLKMFSADVRNSFNNVQQAIAGVNSETNKIAMAQKKPYEDLQGTVAGVINLFTSLEEKSKEQVYLFGDLFAPTNEALEAQDLLAELQSNLKNLKVPESFQENINGAFVTTIDSVKNYNTWIIQTQGELKTLAETAKVAAVQSTAIGKAVQGIAGGEGISIEAQNAAYQAQIDYLEEGAKASAKIAGTTLETYYLTEEGAKINAQIAQNKEKIVSEAVKEQIVLQSSLKLDEQRNVLARERVQNGLRIMKLEEQMKAPGGKLTPEQEFKLALEGAKATLEAAKADLKLAEAKADLQYAVLEAQMKAWGVEASKQEEILGKLRKQLNITKQIAEEKVRSAGIGVQETILGNAAGTAAVTPDIGFGMGVARSAQEGFYNIAVSAAKVTAAQEERKAALEEITAAEEAYGVTAGAVAANIAGASVEHEAALNRLNDAKERAALANQILIDSEKGLQRAAIDTAITSIQAAASAMATLGPDGEFAAALGNMSATLISSWTNVAEVFSTTGATMAQKVGAVASAIANSLGALAGVLNAQANARVASIDREIEAEKKRDGSSAASVAKIKAMEAKKEQIKKKAFETDKKLKIAQAIAATAAGIAAVLPLMVPPTTGIAQALIGIIAATGAAQIAVISGLTYNGGGSAPAAGPSSVAVGSRTNTVDMARATSPAGELAYARGQGGTGTGMTNYTPTPAFTGAKYRAAGGNTAFMVGEQGPELFVPDRPGTIVPADDTQNAVGAPMNVNFSINTVDATGVEELLSGQRAHIIGMIREAANASGEGFLESVNILADQNSVMTRRR